MAHQLKKALPLGLDYIFPKVPYTQKKTLNILFPEDTCYLLM